MSLSYYIIPLFIIIVMFFALKNNANAYAAFTKGAKEGIETCLTIFPLLLAMIFATSILNASNIIQDLFQFIHFNIPIEFYIQGVFRPLSGNAAMAIMYDIFNKYGVDSKIGLISSILQGSTDTTIYIVTLYFGSVKVMRYKHAIKVGILTDILAIALSILMFYYLF